MFIMKPKIHGKVRCNLSCVLDGTYLNCVEQSARTYPNIKIPILSQARLDIAYGI